MIMNITVQELIEAVEQAIATMSVRIVADKDRYVMVNETYVQVADGEGLKGTNITVRSATASAQAVAFDSYHEAYNSGDYYLLDGAGRPILVKPTKADKFFAEEIAAAVQFVSDTKALLNPDKSSSL